MTPILIRRFWSLVETTQTSTLLNLSDADLVHWLLRQFESQQRLNLAESNFLREYVSSRLSLIRDIAKDRQSLNFGFA
jgi:succinate dehydrogenase flavin-adding protein (antitoxin of CptAB toxin-antitoxin module)